MESLSYTPQTDTNSAAIVVTLTRASISDGISELNTQGRLLIQIGASEIQAARTSYVELDRDDLDETIYMSHLLSPVDPTETYTIRVQARQNNDSGSDSWVGARIVVMELGF